MTRARNGAAPGAPAGILWHVIPDDDDRGPSKTFPRCADGDELLVRTPHGEVVEVTVHWDNGCAFIGPDGEAVEAAAIAERPRNPRSGTRLTEAERAATCERSERLQVRLRPGYAARLRALSEADGYSVAEWVETWIEMAEREIADLGQRPKRKRG